MNVNQWYISRKSFVERPPEDVITDGIGLMSSKDMETSSSPSLRGEAPPGGVIKHCGFSAEAASNRPGRGGYMHRIFLECRTYMPVVLRHTSKRVSVRLKTQRGGMNLDFPCFTYFAPCPRLLMRSLRDKICTHGDIFGTPLP